jgi:DNA-binding phage protein
MSYTNASTLYQTLISSAEPSVENQVRAFDFATRSKDVNILLRLLALPNLDASIEEKISKRSEAEILAAWASKSTRSTDDLITRFKNESRATLLTQLADKANLPTELYLTFAKMGKPTISTTLLKNSAVPKEAKIIAAKSAISGMKGSSTTQSKVSELFKGQDEEVISMALINTNSLPSVAALIDKVPTSQHINAVNQVVKLVEEGHQYLGEWYNSNSITTIFKTVEPAAKKILRDLIRKEDSKGALKYAASSMKNLVNAPDIDPIDTAIAQIPNETDMNEITALLKIVQVGGVRHQIKHALQLMIANINSSNQVIVDNYRELDYNSTPLLINRIKNDMDLLKQIFTGYVESSVSDMVFIKNNAFQPLACGDGVDNRKLLAEICTGNVANMLSKTKLGRFAPDELIMYADVKTSLENLGSVAANYINENLGSDDNAWKYFENLLPDWSNSLPALIETSKSFAAEEVNK